MAHFGQVILGYSSKVSNKEGNLRKELVITPAPNGPGDEEMVYTWSQGNKPYTNRAGVQRVTVRCTECLKLKQKNDFPVIFLLSSPNYSYRTIYIERITGSQLNSYCRLASIRS